MEKMLEPRSHGVVVHAVTSSDVRLGFRHLVNVSQPVVDLPPNTTPALGLWRLTPLSSYVLGIW
jgi:hypothetical protein